MQSAQVLSQLSTEPESEKTSLTWNDSGLSIFPSHDKQKLQERLFSQTDVSERDIYWYPSNKLGFYILSWPWVTDNEN